MKPYRIILADDHSLFRGGLKSLLSAEPAFRVVAEAKDGQELLQKLKSVVCDAVILDLSMPEMDGLQALKTIRQKHPKVKVLVLTMQKDAEHFQKAIKNGAHGYLLKEDAFDELKIAIPKIMRDKEYVSPSVSRFVTDRYVRSFDDADSPSLEILTKREKQILTLIANGLANKNIASKLKISPRTVETHRIHLTDKLGIKNTAGLVRFAVSKGLV